MHNIFKSKAISVIVLSLMPLTKLGDLLRLNVIAQSGFLPSSTHAMSKLA